MSSINIITQNIINSPTNENPYLEKFVGSYEATYWQFGWIPIPVPVELWIENNLLQAKVYGHTYELLESGDNKFTVVGVQDSEVSFKVKNGHVKKFTLYLPEYGELTGKPI